MLLYVLTACICLGGGFLQATAGFGFGIFTMTLLPLALGSVPRAASVSMLVSLACSLFLLPGRLRFAQYKIIIPAICAYAVCMPIATYFSVNMPPALLTGILGAVLVALSVFYQLSGGLRVSRSPAAAAGAGACGGVLGGLFNLGGPPVILYCASALDGREPYKEIYMATTQAYFVITTSYGVAVRALNALMPEQVLLWSAAGLAGSLCGSILGRVLYRRIPERLIKKWIYLVIGGSGLWMLARSIWTS